MADASGSDIRLYGVKKETLMKKVILFLSIAVVVMSVSAFAAELPDASKAASKFSRGASNVATCWGEYITQLPKSIESSPDYLTGFVYNIFRGTAFTVRRAAVGLYDMVTFPFPVPAKYAPVIEPETIVTKTMEPLTR